MRQIWVFYFYSPDNLCKFRLFLYVGTVSFCPRPHKCCHVSPVWEMFLFFFLFDLGIFFDVKVSAKSTHARHQSAVWNCGTQALVCGSAIYTSLKLLKSPSVCTHSLPSEKNAKRQSSFIRPVLCLCWIPRHSPKVVKAASQVLSSMWQYRDLRSLYKKVKSLWLS